MKYKAISDFSSPRFGSVKSGKMLEMNEHLAKQMQAAGLIEAKPEVAAKIETAPEVAEKIETKPEVAEKIETKPQKPAKNTK